MLRSPLKPKSVLVAQNNGFRAGKPSVKRLAHSPRLPSELSPLGLDMADGALETGAVGSGGARRSRALLPLERDDVNNLQLHEIGK